MKRFLSVSLLLLLIAATKAGAYHVDKRIPVSGDGGWDYVTCDSAARRLYISHSTQTQVMDIDSLKVIGTIPNTNGVHVVAVAPELGRGYISDGRDNQVTIFDLKNLQTLATVNTDENPDALTYDPATEHLFAFNSRSNTATVFNAKSGETVATLPLGGKPEFAVADGQGVVYLNLEDKGQILKIDSRTLRVENIWSVAPCEEPSSMAMDRASRRIFVGCGNKKMAVVDAANGKVITTLPIGERVDSTAFDPGTNLIFNANGEGTVTVIKEDGPNQYHVVENVPTQRGARTLALDERTHHLFLPAAQLGPVPAPTPEHPRPRPSVLPGTFVILVLSPGS